MLPLTILIEARRKMLNVDLRSDLVWLVALTEIWKSVGHLNSHFNQHVTYVGKLRETLSNYWWEVNNPSLA